MIKKQTDIPSMCPTSRSLHVGYATGWMRRYDQEFDPDRSTSGRLPPARTCSLAKARTGRKNPAPQKLQPYLTDAKTQVQKLLADYKEATAAPQTELIDQADRQRDALIAQISTMIEAMLKMTLMPQKQRRLRLEELNAREIANSFAFPLAQRDL